jgi:hypothetical protein
MKRILFVGCLAAMAFAAHGREESNPVATVDGVAYEYTLKDGKAEIVGATFDAATPNALKIPAALDGHAVTAIGEEVFESNTNLTTVTIPEGVRSIGCWAFGGCSNLVSVTIPKSVEEIGCCAFDGTALVESATNGIAMCDGWVVGAIRGYPHQNVTLPKGTRGLADAAFGKCTNLVSVTVPDGVPRIGFATFAECPRLTTVVLPDSVGKIGWCAFRDCQNLVLLKIPNGVKGVVDLSGCSSLTEIELPEGVDMVNFRGCASLKAVSLPESVRFLPLYAFAGCTNLTSVTIPGSVKLVLPQAFEGCGNLESVTIEEGVRCVAWNAFSDCQGLKSVSLPKGITVFPYAFASCTYLTSVPIPSGSLMILPGAFSGCTNLKTNWTRTSSVVSYLRMAGLLFIVWLLIQWRRAKKKEVVHVGESALADGEMLPRALSLLVWTTVGFDCLASVVPIFGSSEYWLIARMGYVPFVLLTLIWFGLAIWLARKVVARKNWARVALLLFAVSSAFSLIAVGEGESLLGFGLSVILCVLWLVCGFAFSLKRVAARFVKSRGERLSACLFWAIWIVWSIFVGLLMLAPELEGVEEVHDLILWLEAQTKAL